MARVTLSDGRFVGVPDTAPSINRFVIGVKDGHAIIAFLDDDGVTPVHYATLKFPKERFAVLAALCVRAAEELGVPWQGVELKSLPKGYSVH